MISNLPETMSIQDESPLVTLHNAIVAAQASMRHPRMDKGAQTSEALRMILDAATKEAMRELRDLRSRAVEMEKALSELQMQHAPPWKCQVCQVLVPANWFTYRARAKKSDKWTEPACALCARQMFSEGPFPPPAP